MAFRTPPASAGPDAGNPVCRLSAALGGVLDSDLGEAGELDHRIDYSAIPLHEGRAIEYRRRVALELRLAVTDPGESAGVLLHAIDVTRALPQ